MIARRQALQTGLCLCGAAALPAFAVLPDGNHPARHWRVFGSAIQCELCPHGCTIREGATGTCRVRQNRGGSLVTLGYNNPCSINIDPIEKKPFYHVLPGSRAYSIAIAGCNLRCKNCQNWTISQSSPLETSNMSMTPKQVVDEARKAGCSSIAYTYSEPTVWFEYMIDTARLAREAGLKNVLVTCGYINEAPLRELAQYMDAENVDLKSFDDRIYLKLNAGTLAPILGALQTALKLGMWIEVGNLVIPEWSDNLDMIRKMCAWIKTELGAEVPLHFLRFHPMYKLANLYPTPTSTLVAAKKIAHDEGIKFVYVGNVAEVDSNTYCPSCGKAVIARQGFMIKDNLLVNGKCSSCGRAIPGIWKV